MDITPTRLGDLTAQRHDDYAREALIATELAIHTLGALATEEPRYLDGFLTSRRISPQAQLLVKAAVAAGTTADATWAGPLATARPEVRAFISAVDRKWTLPIIGAIKVPSLNVVGAAQTAGATAYWVGEDAPKPLTTLGFAALALKARKLVADLAVSAELIKVAIVDVLMLIERLSVSTLASTLDTALLDPANAGIADVKPASLTNGLVAITPAGDFHNQVGQVLNAISGGAPTRPVLVVSLQTALRLSTLHDLAAIGVKVVVTPAAGNRLIALDADGVAYVDDGGAMRIGEPTIQMNDAPDAPATASTVMVSAWQRNLKVVRGERWTNWAKRADAVAYLTLA